MKKILFVLLLLPFLANAQAPGDRAWITNPGKISRTYTFTEEDDKDMKKNKVDKDQIPFIKMMSQASKWPRSLQAPKGFNDNHEQIKKYVCYYVHTLPSNKAIVRVPANENEEMPELLRPKNDIYFLIDAGAIVFEEPEAEKK
ncbi:MAG: hypothetical protein M0D57_01965 [Sphingobacteriales bacterium JAD_PAG50586_3]|nr:MAG: hypothetical protein M0D57_01965 [Sphingobacteriales bacterium JAD_PAG50586_3]